jgi:hypothetical protein
MDKIARKIGASNSLQTSEILQWDFLVYEQVRIKSALEPKSEMEHRSQKFETLISEWESKDHGSLKIATATLAH